MKTLESDSFPGTCHSDFLPLEIDCRELLLLFFGVCVLFPPSKTIAKIVNANKGGLFLIALRVINHYNFELSDDQGTVYQSFKFHFLLHDT